MSIVILFLKLKIWRMHPLHEAYLFRVRYSIICPQNENIRIHRNLHIGSKLVRATRKTWIMVWASLLISAFQIYVFLTCFFFCCCSFYSVLLHLTLESSFARVYRPYIYIYCFSWCDVYWAAVVLTNTNEWNYMPSLAS